MAGTVDVLRKLHRVHKQLSDLRGRLDRGPRQVQVAEGTVTHLEAGLEQSRADVKRVRILVDERQLQLREREARISDWQVKLNSASSNREYQALREQIAADQQANSVLEDEILEGLEKIDQLTGAVQQAELHLQRARDEAAKVRQRVEGEREQLEAERDRVEAELRQTERELPGEFRAEYERVARVRGEEALAQVDGEVCGGCFQRLTTQMMNDLYLAKPLFCRNCGALLYLPERN